ncbi:nuclear transport factor 2 family protein [Flavobacteriaceae bacterium S356]|uniref:Nuclear transport factor 2 family protein n=1 Tax=Asprobacillus argus TaxID=3076534 RepID=A0ABU3LGM4_9FLAO|nr:nuclear transport factor 2 family protein [Flavobacteriaceae bacterium S356]
MKKLSFLFIFTSIFTFAQSNTEVFLFDLSKSGKLSNQRNISKNPGYDSQPSFYAKDKLLFTATRNGQTDIVLYDISTNKKIDFLSNTPKGGEYSPQRIPKSKNVSAVRLDNDGLQRFYSYDYTTKESKEVIPELKVAYPMWYNKNTVVSSVIVGNDLDLIISDIKSGENYTVQKKAGRSFHHIPNSKLISYISKANRQWEIRSLNVKTKKTQKIVNTSGDYEDICWLPDGTLLQAKGDKILKFNPKTDTDWSLFHSFKNSSIHKISRIRVSKDGTKIAIVAQEDPVFFVEQQLKAYNNRDIEAFVKAFAEDVKVYNFPNTLNYEGRENMRKGYADFFARTKDLHCKIVKRIVKGNIVIDEELVTANGRTFDAVAIYEIENGTITKVTFL